MPDTLSPKRAALKERLIAIAEQEVTEGGIVALRARDLAASAGCAVGAIYTVYSDLGEIAVEVNRITLTHITHHLTQSISGLDRETPADVLISLSQAYVDYALHNGPRWRTLFAVGVPEGDNLPAMFDATAPIVAMYVEQLEKIHPAHTSRRLEKNARMLLAAVHGLVVLGQEDRLAIISPSDLKRSVSALVQAAAESDGPL